MSRINDQDNSFSHFPIWKHCHKYFFINHLLCLFLSLEKKQRNYSFPTSTGIFFSRAVVLYSMRKTYKLREFSSHSYYNGFYMFAVTVEKVSIIRSKKHTHTREICAINPGAENTYRHQHHRPRLQSSFYLDLLIGVLSLLRVKFLVISIIFSDGSRRSKIPRTYIYRICQCLYHITAIDTWKRIDMVCELRIYFV